MNPALHVSGLIITRRKMNKEHDYQIEGLLDKFGDLVWKLGGVVRLSDGKEILNPNWIPEWSRFSEADAAATSLTAYGDQKGRETVAIYDALARVYTARILNTKKDAA